MIPPVIVGRQLSLGIDCPAELAAPDNQRVFEHAALFEISDQGGARLVDGQTLSADVLRQRAVLVPAAVEELHEGNTPLSQPPGDDAVARKAARFLRVGAVHLHRRFGLIGEIHQFREPKPACETPFRTATCGSLFPGRRILRSAAR